MLNKPGELYVRRCLLGGIGRRTVVVVLLAVFPDFAVAQEALWGVQLVSKIDSLAEATLVEGPTAGLTIGVKRGDDLLMLKGFGYADLEQRVPASAETGYRIGSITKQFTAAAIMQLVEAGRVSLDGDVSLYLPNFPLQGHDVTVRHLLTHTSGIRNYTSLRDAFLAVSRLDITQSELLDLFKDEPFDFPPGSDHRYSNSGYALLGMIVEAVGGASYEDYVEANVIGPLGLPHTSYCHERDLIFGRSEGYARAEGALVNDEPISMTVVGAAGALCSSAGDLLSWAVALRSGRVVSEESYRAMTTSGQLNGGEVIGYGFGLAIGKTSYASTAYGGSPFAEPARIAHVGNINGFRAVLAYYPEFDLDIVVLSNTQSSDALSIEAQIATWTLGPAIKN